jgi:hypothetical protein
MEVLDQRWLNGAADEWQGQELRNWNRYQYTVCMMNDSVIANNVNTSLRQLYLSNMGAEDRRFNERSDYGMRVIAIGKERVIRVDMMGTMGPNNILSVDNGPAPATTSPWATGFVQDGNQLSN